MISVIEPATEQVMAEVPRAGLEETDAAVAAARAAFPAWRAVAPADRSALLRGLADAIEARAEDLAVLEARNAGKPIGDARGEMGMVVETFRYYAGAPERLLGDTIPVAGGVDMTFREPLGVVGPDRAVELPAGDRLVEGGARARRRQHHRAQARRAHAADRAGAGEDRAGGRASRGRAERGGRPGQRVRAAAGGAPRRGQGGVHGLDRGGAGDRGGGRRHDQAGHAGAGWKVRQRGVRGRRPRQGGRGRADGRVRQRRPGLLRPLAHPGGAVRPRRLPGGADRARGGAAGRRPARRVHGDGAAHLLRATARRSSRS